MKDRSELAAKVEQLLAAPEACGSLKKVCTQWLKAQGTADEKAASAALLAELEEDVASIDFLIAFAGSDRAAAFLGAEKAAALKAQAEKAKEDGATTCICSACTIGAEILEHREWLS